MKMSSPISFQAKAIHVISRNMVRLVTIIIIIIIAIAKESAVYIRIRLIVIHQELISTLNSFKVARSVASCPR
jgi:hypothetical protein